MREQFERDATRQLTRQFVTKQPVSGALPDAALADGAQPATLGGANQKRDDLDYAALLEVEPALICCSGGKKSDLLILNAAAPF